MYFDCCLHGITPPDVLVAHVVKFPKQATISNLGNFTAHTHGSPRVYRQKHQVPSYYGKT